MESTEMINGGGDHVVELVSNSNAALAEEIAPLLNDGDKPKINIFTLPYSRRQPKDLITKVVEADVSFFTRFVSWTWSGSMYSGVLCMVLSSVIYFVMEIILDVFSVQSIPLFETVFARCLIILVSSYIWLRRSAQSVFGPTHVRNLLLSRALMGCLSLFTFVYSIQSLPLSQAIVLNLTTPIMASIAARIFLHEKLKLVDIAGQTSSFFALLLIIQPMLSKQGGLAENGELNNKDIVRGNHSAYAVLLGLFSSLSGGISYCLIRAGAKASEQPVFRIGIRGLGFVATIEVIMDILGMLVETGGRRWTGRNDFAEDNKQWDDSDQSGQRAMALEETKLTRYVLNWGENIQQLQVSGSHDYIIDWAVIKGEVMARFIPSTYEDESFAKLQTLRQVRNQSVDDYASDFYLLSSRMFYQTSPTVATTPTLTKLAVGTKPAEMSALPFVTIAGRHMRCECPNLRKTMALISQQLHDHVDEALEQLLSSEVTVFWFSLFACPAAAICTFALQTFVVPDLYTFFLMVVLGMLAFFAEVLLARALHLEKTSRAANMQYIEPFLSGILGILLSRLALSFSRIVGCLLILLSICSTVYFGTEKDVE
ncbi:hypothetical protein GIB67_032749 [Kingdonia uniflora]|uniref:EamA domain-containing protein n=1 Tax=Kingdonia uniflora TaxID=39325 RepID=A0A7J7MWH0_9MAGN|nr:hypothetical protein GIB67_032749 [Kingdonia uniflora]